MLNSDGEFDLDLTGFPLETDLPGESYVDASAAQLAAPGASPEERLDRLLAPYSADSVDKARKLLQRGQVQLAKQEGTSSWFNVQGSTLYVTKITRGQDFLFAECSCPNGIHRGGDAICYHSIASRVVEAGLSEEWLS